MTSRSPGFRRRTNLSLSSNRNIQASLVSPRTLFISAPPPGRLALPSPAKECGDSLRVTKLLFNVTIENSLGPVQVMMSPEGTVADLVRAALAIYGKEKRRPFLKDADPKRYNLHYSPFSLQSNNLIFFYCKFYLDFLADVHFVCGIRVGLKPSEKLINLGSRNFFMYSRPCKSSCSEEANMTSDSAFPLIMLVDLLL